MRETLTAATIFRTLHSNTLFKVYRYLFLFIRLHHAVLDELLRIRQVTFRHAYTLPTFCGGWAQCSGSIVRWRHFHSRLVVGKF